MKIIATVGLIVLGAIVTYVQSRSGSGGGVTGGAGAGVPRTSSTSADAPTQSESARPSEQAARPPTREAENQSARRPEAASSTGKASGGSSSSPGQARIAAWNIEWFGKPEDRSGPARGIAQDPREVAAYIAASRAPIVGVCEIVTLVPGRPIRSREVESMIVELNRATAGDWKYALNPGRADGDQLTGVIWNAQIVTARTHKGTAFDPDRDVPWAVPVKKGRSSQGSGLWSRPPHAMKFSLGEGQTDVVVIMVHMKADYQGDFAAHRAEEARSLVDALPEVRRTFGDQDIVIIGDTNCVGDREPAVEALVNAGMRDLNRSGMQTHWRGGSMDRAIVPALQPEFASSGFQVVSEDYLRKMRWEPQDFKRRLSDHYLVVTDVQVMPDDD